MSLEFTRRKSSTEAKQITTVAKPGISRSSLIFTRENGELAVSVSNAFQETAHRVLGSPRGKSSTNPDTYDRWADLSAAEAIELLYQIDQQQ